MNIEIRPAETYDLRPINRLIESAVMNWPTGARVKRLSVTPLQYDAVDLDHYEIVVGTIRGEVVAVAVWDPHSVGRPDMPTEALLHGLYVLPMLQQQGIGRQLIDAVLSDARIRNLPVLTVKAQRLSRDYFEHQGFEARAVNDDEYPWQYWKRVS